MFTALLLGFLLAHYEEPVKRPLKILTQCPRCGISLSGKKSCCGQNGAWFGNCGLPGDFDFDYTWNEGIQSCQTAGVRPPIRPANPPANPPAIPPSRTNICSECAILKKSGKSSCCAPGGSWYNNCGNVGDRSFDHTWVEGIQACRKTPTPIDIVPKNPSSTCPKCGTNKKNGKRSCCAPNGAWFNKCGNEGDERYGHTWVEGIQACKKNTISDRSYSKESSKRLPQVWC